MSSIPAANLSCEKAYFPPITIKSIITQEILVPPAMIGAAALAGVILGPGALIGAAVVGVGLVANLPTKIISYIGRSDCMKNQHNLKAIILAIIIVSSIALFFAGPAIAAAALPALGLGTITYGSAFKILLLSGVIAGIPVCCFSCCKGIAQAPSQNR